MKITRNNNKKSKKIITYALIVAILSLITSIGLSSWYRFQWAENYTRAMQTGNQSDISKYDQYLTNAWIGFAISILLGVVIVVLFYLFQFKFQKNNKPKEEN